DPAARGARPQPPGRGRGPPPAPADRLHRRERVGQVVARLRHPLRRGPAPLPAELLPLHAAVPRTARPARRGPAPQTPAARPSPPRRPPPPAGPRTGVVHSPRLLSARAGVIVCPRCGQEVRPASAADVLAAVGRLPPGTRFSVAFPSRPEPGAEAEWAAA